MSKVCDRTWGYTNPQTVRVVDGVFLCPSCNQPTKLHKQAKAGILPISGRD